MDKYREVIYKNYRDSGYSSVVTDNPKDIKSRMEGYRLDLGVFLPEDKSSKILDLGCGSGYLLDLLLKSGYRNTSGVDISSDQVAFAAKNKLPVVCEDALSFLRSHKEYDVIIATDMIEHLNKGEIVSLLLAIRDSLKPGGFVILRTVNASSIVGNIGRYFDFTHETSFTEHSLQQVLVSCGFTNVIVTDNKIPFGFKPTRLARWVIGSLLLLILRFVYTIETGYSCQRLYGKFLVAKARKGE